MDYIAKTTTVDKEAAECVIVGIFKPKCLSKSAKKLDKLYHGNISKICQRSKMDGSLGCTTALHNPGPSKHGCIVIVGCGEQDDFTVNALRRALSAAAEEVKKSNAHDVINCLIELPVINADIVSKVQTSVIAVEQSMYSYSKTKPTATKNISRLKKMKFLANKSVEITTIRKGQKFGKAISNSMSFAKDLGNLPGNICTPTYLAKQARTLKKGSRKLRVNVVEEAQMKKLGMHALLSVSRGSVEPAKLVSLEYKGGAPGTRPIILVGKGITFDTGGISLKPGATMDEMKFDMCGAASVLGDDQGVL